MPSDDNRVTPLCVSKVYHFESSIISPNSPLSPIEKLKVAKRQVLNQECPARFSTIEQFFNTDNTRSFHFNKLKNTEENNNHLIEDEPVKLCLKQNKNKSIKLSRRKMTINNVLESKRVTSPEVLRYMLEDIDQSPTSISSPSKDILLYDENKMIKPTIHVLTETYNQATNNCGIGNIEEHMIPIGYADNMEYKEVQNDMIRQQNNYYITKGDNETNFSSPPSPIQMINNKEPYTKIWIPYFTGLSTIIIFIYFIISIIYNSTLTGNVIQISPFNQMIGPAPETLIYLGARYIPCIKPSKSYSTTENIYNCPNSINSPVLIENLNLTLNTVENCSLQTICSGTKFNRPDKPDQKYRFISATFIHSGIIQLFINIFAHIWLGFLVERRINPFRYGAIWLGSGIFGYVFGALFVPDGNISVGCSASLMGVMAFLVIDLISNWNHIDDPYSTVAKIIACFIFTWIIGYLPGYDNFSHIGGFLAGLLITLIVMPLTKSENIPFNCDTKIRNYEQIIQFWMMRIMAVAFIIISLWILLHIFSTNLNQSECSYCQYFSCIPINNMCTLYPQFINY